MLSKLVALSVRHRFVVIALAAIIALVGAIELFRLPIDAVPDITNVQVQVLTKSPALGPVEMEQFVTYPVEAAMNGLPRLVQIRSVSRYGLSAVTVVFQDGVDVYFARQLVNERLAQAREAIPEGLAEPEMGPVTTGLGDVFQFTVDAASRLPLRVTVTVTVTAGPPLLPSVTVLSSIVIVGATGATSLSVMVPVPDEGEPTV